MLTLPIFVLIAGIPAREAVAVSMVVVGGTSLLGAGLHFRRGNFKLKAAVVFAASGSVAAYFGSYLTQMVSQRVRARHRTSFFRQSASFGTGSLRSNSSL